MATTIYDGYVYRSTCLTGIPDEPSAVPTRPKRYIQRADAIYERADLAAGKGTQGPRPEGPTTTNHKPGPAASQSTGQVPSVPNITNEQVAPPASQSTGRALPGAETTQ